jgi:hypothetical protein
LGENFNVNYSNRQPIRKTPSTAVGLRLPFDLLRALDMACRINRLTRTRIIVAALRAHLKTPDPAELGAKEK